MLTIDISRFSHNRGRDVLRFLLTIRLSGANSGPIRPSSFCAISAVSPTQTWTASHHRQGGASGPSQLRMSVVELSLFLWVLDDAISVLHCSYGVVFQLVPWALQLLVRQGQCNVDCAKQVARPRASDAALAAASERALEPRADLGQGRAWSRDERGTRRGRCHPRIETGLAATRAQHPEHRGPHLEVPAAATGPVTRTYEVVVPPHAGRVYKKIAYSNVGRNGRRLQVRRAVPCTTLRRTLNQI